MGTLISNGRREHSPLSNLESEKNVRVGGKRVGEGVDGWGVPTGGVECEVYPADMGRHSVPEAEK